MKIRKGAKIFCEGESDKNFIEALLKKYFAIEEKEVKELIVVTEGKDNLRNQPALGSESRKAVKAKNILIFDADYKESGGGLVKRLKEYQHLEKELNVVFDIFLLPNNKDDGELEDLVRTCFKSDFLFFDDCWQKMINCFETKGQNLKLKLPSKDGYLFSYVDLFSEYKDIDYGKKKTNRNYLDEGIWVLDKERNYSLKILVDFLEEHLFA